MKNKNILTKVLTLLGMVLAWFPLLFTVFTSIVGSISNHVFLFDYLMPAEFFPFALAGSLLLLWAAQRAHFQQKRILWGLLAEMAFLIGGTTLASVSGLSSGAIEPRGWVFLLVSSLLVFYSLAVLWQCIVSIFLLKSVFSPIKNESIKKAP